MSSSFPDAPVCFHLQVPEAFMINTPEYDQIGSSFHPPASYPLPHHPRKRLFSIRSSGNFSFSASAVRSILRSIVPKPFKTISYVIEYLLLRLLQMLLSIVPRRIALAAGACCGSLIHRLGIYRTIVVKNQEHVGLWDKPSMDRITRSLYRNIGRYAVDFLRPPHPLPPHVIHDAEKIEPLFALGKGTITILGHLGNWEILATIFGKRTGRLHVVAQPMNNTIVDKWLLAKRTASSVTTIYTKQALRKMIDVIRRDGIIAILIDQFSRRHGTPAPFLGKEAKTVRTVAGLVRKTGCSVVSAEAIMRPDGVYEITLSAVPEPDRTGLSEEEAIVAVQKLHNDVLSDQIIAHPDHWFGWFHRRFRGYVNYGR